MITPRVPRSSWKQRLAAGCSPVCGAVAAGSAAALWHGLLAAVGRAAGATAVLHSVDLLGGALAVAVCALLAETLAYEAIRPRLLTRALPDGADEKTVPLEIPEPAAPEAIVPRHPALPVYSKGKALWN